VERLWCIAAGTELDPSGEEGLADVQILEAIVQAAALGRTVTLTPVERTERPSGALEFRKPPAAKVDTVKAPSPSK
jgi:hypothetical protein